MEHVMGIFMFMFCVFTSLVTSITVSSNGNSPEIKMIGGLMVDTLKKQITVKPTTKESANLPEQKSQQLEPLLTKLAINERYRRLIPYITFYYANDLTTPRIEQEKTVEVEKAELREADEYAESNQRQPKKIINSPSRIIPRYQGNRLTQFNIASANPIKVFYKDGVPLYHNSNRVTSNFNPLLPEHVLINNDYNTRRFISKPTVKPHTVPVISPSRKPYLNAHKPEDTPNVQYYVSEKETPLKYKLVPYEQTPPVRVVQQNNNVYETKRPYIVSLSIPREEVYIKPKPTRPQYFYDSINNTPSAFKKQPLIRPETFYENQSLKAPVSIEDGFKPILNPNQPYSTKLLDYGTTTPKTYITNFERKEQNTFVETSPDESVTKNKQNIYQYIVEDHTYKPVEYTRPNAVNLAALLNSLQRNQSIPKLITRENVGSSIRTLLQALNALNAAPKEMYHQSPVLNTPMPFASPKNVIDTTLTDKQSTSTIAPDHDKTEDIYIPDEPYLAAVKNPSQHIDDFQPGEGTIQRFPLPITSDEEGGTPGRPGIDYPTLTTIPQTVFDCKTQRYKGFFADPETRCQVWHYCDLNGGQASFLCPNGTIFSQAGLTCDWWFNVRCASTTQLYVLNESLYKYILPHSPKFPEDFSGPLVDKYLTLKFKEMEEEFKKNKNKQTKTDKVESEDSDEKESDTKNEHEEGNSQNTVSEASVIVESVGASGKVERLNDE